MQNSITDKKVLSKLKVKQTLFRVRKSKGIVASHSTIKKMVNESFGKKEKEMR